ncbi:hypothetical protein GWK36_11510 [Caldichromatium japonicum]|uniref:Uncharacterized protein n=1 Tax=Caldichromatium japonicum TaxID=2699430 RepID=A0A6G7VFD7_9GAMM|nr:anaerobic ribonucleoside-triphosphate reductase [Caldichromatium japonicum]QIK38507.1 hypothetical protein GWK36_11510 [Caldichromatium japonicum]
MQETIKIQAVELKTEERTPCEVWTRVMGYHRPVSAFNAGKQSEHRERRYFREGVLDNIAVCCDQVQILEDAHA